MSEPHPSRSFDVVTSIEDLSRAVLHASNIRCHPPSVGDPNRFDDARVDGARVDGAPVDGAAVDRDVHDGDAQSSGVFVKRGGHAGASVVERVLRSADDARRRGDPFRRWRRLGAPPEWQQLSVAQRRAVEVMFWGTRALPDDSW